MKLHLFGLVLSTAFVATAAANPYTDNKKTITHDCAKSPDATVSGNENKITLTGTCTSVSIKGNKNVLTIESSKEVSVTGNENTVTVTASDKISTMGNKNTVTWKKGISDKKPSVSNLGTKNKISEAK